MSKMLPINKVVESISITHKFDKPVLKFLNTSDVENGKIININNLPIDELKGQAKKTIQKHDILFSEIRPKNRHFAYVDIDDTYDYVVSTKLMVLRNINPAVDNKYFYYFLTNDHMLSILQDRAENRIGSFPQITFDLLSEYYIRVPQLADQQKIASVLSALDEKIALNKNINTELESLAKTIYNYWFVQFDFPDENGKPYKTSGGAMEWNEELKREIPKGWEVGKLSDVANITMGQSPEGSSYNDKGEGMVFYQGSTDFSFRFPEVRMFTTDPKRFADELDILLSVRAPVGTINVANENCCIGRGLASLNSKNKAQSYLLYLMFYFKTMFDVQNRTGTTFGSIDKDTLYDLKFAKPPVELQKEFQKLVGNYDKMILIRSRETQELTQLRDFLLPMLMNGQAKV